MAVAAAKGEERGAVFRCRRSQEELGNETAPGTS
ncbi:hypothetical protein SHL15_2831 [Streptomyces hygroscopicus subsp. limoneus]|nr:hypothetical protein SHL15_2831 [Streptomyces hygroscopicus subsp. limoneus]